MPPPAYDPARHDRPLQTNRTQGGWTGRPPREYFVRAMDAEQALALAVYCVAVNKERIADRHYGIVALTPDGLDATDQRTFRVLVGKKPGPNHEKWLATEISLVQESGDSSD